MSPVKHNLAEKAMLVSLQASMWTGRTKDKVVTSEVTSAKHCDADAGTWWTHLVPKKAIAKIDAARMRCRTIHRSMTLPWMDGGMRILPSDMFMTYTERMRPALAKFDEEVEDFIRDYPDIQASAAKRLGKLLDNKKMPSAEDIRSRFGIRQDILPLPSVDDFRVKMGDDEANEIRKKIESSIEDMTAKAMSDVWRRLAELIEKIEQTLGEPKKIFRDSLIGNLKEFCELLPKLNLVGDKNLEDFRKDIVERLANLKPMDLRESKQDRSKAHKVAKDVLAKMQGYV